MLSKKHELQHINRVLQDTQKRLDELEMGFKNHKELHYRYVTSEALTDIYERTSDALTVEIDGKNLRIKEILEALLEYFELNVTEVERHIEIDRWD